MNIEVTQLDKVKFRQVEEVIAACELSKDAASLLPHDTPVINFFIELIKKEYVEDAVKILAYGLPKRESIWWGYLCAMFSEGEDPRIQVKEVLTFAKQWVYKPEDKLRRQLGVLAEHLNYETATSWLAMAVFWSGGSIAAENAPEVAPAENLYASAVAGAVMFSALLNEPEKAPDKYKKFLLQGIDIANGGNGGYD